MDLYGPPQRDERPLLEFLVLLAKHKRLILACQLVTAVAVGIVLWLLPNVYTGTARLMPPQQGQSAASAALGLLAGAAGGMPGGIGQALGLKNPNDLYVGILKSDTIADRIIERFGLRARYDEDTLVETREALAKQVSITTGRDGLIVIQVDDEDPKVAADMANAYVEELDRLSQQLAVSEASQRRLFFERELAAVRDKLAGAEDALRAAQEKTGLIQPEGQAKAMFDAITELGARIAAKEVELASLRTFATPQNPKVLRAEEEAASLKRQLARLESADAGKRAQGDIRVPTSQVPEAGLEYLRRARDLKYQETLYELLAKQYELAKIDEGKDAALIQAVDRATPPDYKSRPKRGLLLVVALFLATLAGIGWALLRERMAALQGAPILARLRGHLRS
jgi:uncharacterized protein involved in exopolysaccharide biosynthesis